MDGLTSEIEIALRLFTERDPEEGLRRLMELSRPMLLASLRPRLPNDQDREEIVQDVATKVWQHRAKFVNSGAASWLSYVYRITETSFIDFSRKRRADLQDCPDIEEIPSLELQRIDKLLSFALDREQIYRTADRLWLGVSSGDHRRKLLAGKLLYLDNLSWQEVIRLLSRGSAGRKPLERHELDEWLLDLSVLRHVAFHALHYRGSMLVAVLLELPPCDKVIEQLFAEVQRCEPEGAPPGGWTWLEVFVILMRYFKGLTVQEVCGFRKCGLTEAQVRSICVRCESRFPFIQVMAKLRGAFGERDEARAALGGRQLWQRLAFEYWYRDGLHQKDIHSRIAPAAKTVGRSLTLATLNGWLSMRRLEEQVFNEIAKENGI